MSERILGTMEIDGGVLFFTSERVIVTRAHGILKKFLIGGGLGVAIAKHRATRKYRKLSDVPPEDILAHDKKNFAIPYSKIAKVEMKKPSILIRGNITMFTTEKMHKFWMTKKKEFKNQVNLVRSILPDKISA